MSPIEIVVTILAPVIAGIVLASLPPIRRLAKLIRAHWTLDATASGQRMLVRRKGGAAAHVEAYRVRAGETTELHLALTDYTRGKLTSLNDELQVGDALRLVWYDGGHRFAEVRIGDDSTRYYLRPMQG